jgi:hypothetical protein
LSFSSSNTSVATIAGDTITFVGAGTTTITVSVAVSADNVYAATSTTAIVTVNTPPPPPPPPQQAVLTISENSPNGASIYKNSDTEANITILQEGTYSLNNFVSSNNSSLSLNFMFPPQDPNYITFTENNTIMNITLGSSPSFSTSFYIIVNQNSSINYSAPNPVALIVEITI